MSEKAQGKAKARKRSVARDLTARTTTGLTGGIVADTKPCVIVYNGHAGLGANGVVAGDVKRGIVTNNKDPEQ